ncbi:alcohol dehydrogenase [Celeribacter sp. SCSIO 80788]|uniref:alcohol dehydrogenase n=1 Tax=Celeribacter sp. SCSIO 80788 TaxID=3117013 RepID=UPI003DA657B0
MKTTSYQLPRYGTAPVAVEHEAAVPTGAEVLLEVEYAGVCHSDVYIMDGYQDLGDGEKIDFSESDMPLPLTMGHEIVARVCAVGPEADVGLIGERRLIYPWIGCGTCTSCKAGLENHCETPASLGIFSQGGYARHVLVPDERYLVAIGGLDPAWASTLACSGLTVYSALRQIMPVKPGATIAVIGAGGLGLMAVSMARALGIDAVIACDISEDRLATARDLGARAVVDTSRPDAVEALREAAGGALYGVIDTVGLPATTTLALEAVMKGARVVLVGLQGGRIALPLPSLPFKATALIGTYTGSLSELREVVDLACTGALRPMPVWERDMTCLCDSLDRLRQGSVLGRIVLKPDQKGV